MADDDAVSRLCGNACCCHAERHPAPQCRNKIATEVRQKFVSTLVAEVKRFTKISNEFLSLEKARMNSSKADAKVVADEQNMQRTKENNQLLFEEFDNPSESYKHDGLEWKSMGEFLTAKKIQLLEGSRAFRDWEQGRTKPGVRSSAAFFD